MVALVYMSTLGSTSGSGGGGGFTGTVTTSQISDMTAVGKNVATAATQAAARTAIGAGTSNVVIGTTAGTAKDGAYVPAWTEITGRPTLATVATTGAYTDLSGRPTLSTVATTGAYADLTGKPTLSTVAGTGAYSDLTGKPTLAVVATSGLYADLSGRPTIPSLPGDIGAATAAQGAKADTAVQPAGLTKAAVGLANVDNTSDANKPISTATQTALNAKVGTNAVFVDCIWSGTAWQTLAGAAVPTAAMPPRRYDSSPYDTTGVTVPTAYSAYDKWFQKPDVS